MQLADLTYAEIARTVASGRHLGTAQIAWSPRPFRVRHANDAEGNPILLCRSSGGLARALMRRDGSDVAAVLSIDSAAGRVWISGWAHPIHGDAARAAALEFSAVNPVSDLLAVGHGFELHHLDVAEVRLETGCCSGRALRGSLAHSSCQREIIEVDVAAYAAASPMVEAAAEAEDGSSPVM